MIVHGAKLLAFDVREEKWCAPFPLDVDGSICGMVTVDNKLRIAVNDGSQISLYRYNAGSGSRMKAVSAPVDFARGSAVITSMRVGLRADNKDNPLTAQVRRNGRLNAEFSREYTLSRTGSQFVGRIPPNTRNCQSFQVVLEQDTIGGDAGFEGVSVLGEVSEIEIQGD